MCVYVTRICNINFDKDFRIRRCVSEIKNKKITDIQIYFMQKKMFIKKIKF